VQRAELIEKIALPPGRRVTSLAFSPSGKQLAVVREAEETVLLYSEGLKRLRSLKKHTLEAWAAAFSSDGRWFATAAMDDRVILWNTDNGEPFAILEGHKEGVSGIALSPDNRTLAALCGNRTVKLWSIPTQRELATLTFDKPSAYLDFAPDGKTLIACKPWPPEPRFEFWHSRFSEKR